MIMSIIAISFFRGSPILPAGAVLDKPLHVRSAEDRPTVHSKLLAKTSKLKQSKKESQAHFIEISNSVKIKYSTVLMWVSLTALSTHSTDTSAFAVTRESPRAQSGSDLNPSLLDEVGVRLSRLYDTELGGTPPMLGVCLNVIVHILVVLLVFLGPGCILLIVLSGEVAVHSFPRPGARYMSEARLLIGRRIAARYSHRCTVSVINRRSSTLHIYDDPGVARHSDLNNGPVGPISSPFIATHDRVISRDIVGFEA